MKDQVSRNERHEQTNKLIDDLLGDKPYPEHNARTPIVHSINQPPLTGESRLKQLGKGFMRRIDLLMTGENPFGK